MYVVIITSLERFLPYITECGRTLHKVQYLQKRVNLCTPFLLVYIVLRMSFMFGFVLPHTDMYDPQERSAYTLTGCISVTYCQLVSHTILCMSIY